MDIASPRGTGALVVVKNPFPWMEAPSNSGNAVPTFPSNPYVQYASHVLLLALNATLMGM